VHELDDRTWWPFGLRRREPEALAAGAAREELSRTS
jgi:hypothetical protein